MEVFNNEIIDNNVATFYKNREDFLILLKKNIENLSIKQQTHILEMMVNENVNISENNNGSFINISSLKDNFLYKIHTYVDLQMKQTEMFNKIENQKDKMREKYMN